MRRSLAAGIWLALTVTATLIVWAAVSVVAADVTDRPAPVVDHQDVVVALAAGTTPPPVATTAVTTVAPRTAPATSVAASSVPRTTRPSTRPAVPAGPLAGPAAPTAPAPTTTTTTTRPPAPPVAPPTTVALPGTATYSTDGGYVGVACTGLNTIRLVAALPDDGFQAVVGSPGPFGVQVNFVGRGRNIGVSAACIFGQPFEYTNPGSGPPGS